MVGGIKTKNPISIKEFQIGKDTEYTYSNFSTSTLLITAISGLYDSTYENQNHPFSLILGLGKSFLFGSVLELNYIILKQNGVF